MGGNGQLDGPEAWREEAPLLRLPPCSLPKGASYFAFPFGGLGFLGVPLGSPMHPHPQFPFLAIGITSFLIQDFRPSPNARVSPCFAFPSADFSFSRVAQGFSRYPHNIADFQFPRRAVPVARLAEPATLRTAPHYFHANAVLYRINNRDNRPGGIEIRR